MKSKCHPSTLTVLGCAVFLLSAGCDTTQIAKGLSNVPTYSQGQPFESGPFQITVDKAYWANQLGGYGLVKKPQGKFLVVHTVVKNLRNQTLTWSPPPIFTLTNPAGAEFNSGGQALSMDDLTGKCILGQGINPGMTLDGLTVFDIPPGEGYKLTLSVGVFRGGFKFSKGAPIAHIVLSPGTE